MPNPAATRATPADVAGKLRDAMTALAELYRTDVDSAMRLGRIARDQLTIMQTVPSHPETALTAVSYEEFTTP